jgi:3-keto-5-aminohexanoate cleavage enzyme
MVPTRQDSPHVPLSAEEIAEQVLEVAPLGVTSVHLHARGADGAPVWQRDYFEDIILRIKEHNTDLVICVTTSGRIESELSRRADVLDITGLAKPDMASLTLSSMNFASEASVNSPSVVQQLAQTMLERGIKPELEVFDTGMLNYVHYLITKGLLTPPYVMNFILGGPATAQATALDLGLLMSRVPEHTLWLAGGIGRSQLTANALALSSGGGVRIGLEDNLHWDSARKRLATNKELVERVVGLAEILESAPMSPGEFRKVWLRD